MAAGAALPKRRTSPGMAAGAALASYLAMTIPATVFRRSLLMLGTTSACLFVLNAQAQEPARATEPLAAIRAAAQSFARSQVPAGPGAGETTVTAGQLDNRLRLTQ